MTTIYGDGGYGLGLYDAPDILEEFDATTQYYQGLLIMQYQVKPKAKATVGVIVQAAVADDIYAAVRDGFDLETAVGAQLDILAGYRGISRVIVGLDLTRDYFAMPYYDDPDPGAAHGFAYYGDVVTWYWLFYADAQLPVYAMTDDELRRITKLRARAHSSPLGLADVDAILYEFFGTNVTMVDNGDMTVTYAQDPGDVDTLFYIARQTDSLPKPAGVALNFA